MCYPCVRTRVTYVSGLYSHTRKEGPAGRPHLNQRAEGTKKIFLIRVSKNGGFHPPYSISRLAYDLFMDDLPTHYPARANTNFTLQNWVIGITHFITTIECRLIWRIQCCALLITRYQIRVSDKRAAKGDGVYGASG